MGHWRFGGGHHGGQGRHAFSARPSGNQSGGLARGRPKPILWVIALLGAGLWSLLAWLAYASVDPVIGWIAASAGLMKSAATAAGANDVLGNLDVSGFFGQALAFLRLIGKPAVIVLWAVGFLGLLAAPLILSKLVRLRGRLS